MDKSGGLVGGNASSFISREVWKPRRREVEVVCVRWGGVEEKERLPPPRSSLRGRTCLMGVLYT